MSTLLNGFLSALTKADQISLLKGSRKIFLYAGDVLTSHDQPATKIYFPIRGSIAFYVGVNGASKTAHGMAVELIGREGVAGLQLALGFDHSPFQLIVQSPGEAYVVDFKVAQQLVQRKPQVLLFFSKYLWSTYAAMAALVVKAYGKDIKIRLAHWLLLSEKRCAPDPLHLTQLHLSKMLGVRRSSISIAAREIKMKRYISYTRGQISVTNSSALENLSNS